MFWLGLIIGWFTAGPLVILALALVQTAARAEEEYERNHDK